MKVTLIGAGNLGHHLGLELHRKGVCIKQVFSRNEAKAKSLASKINAAYTSSLKLISSEADLYILAVRDAAIAGVAEKLASNLPLQDKLIVHTSGVTPSTALQPFFRRYGVFYPLQTFSISRAVDYFEIPICVDAREKGDLASLTALANKLSNKVFKIDDEQRVILHVAAVFVNNFANHLFHIGHQILEKEKLPFELLKPLIRETALKIEDRAPLDMQTGPAIRGDEASIIKHLKYLEKFPQYRQLYDLLSNSIVSGMPAQNDARSF